MVQTSVAELKARLSHFLRLVKEGNTLEVRSHRHAVARIVPVDDGSVSLVIKPERPVAELRRLKGVRIRTALDPVAALLRDRSRR